MHDGFVELGDRRKSGSRVVAEERDDEDRGDILGDSGRGGERRRNGTG